MPEWRVALGFGCSVDLVRTTEIAEKLSLSSGWGTPGYIDHGASAAVFRVEHPVHGVAALKIYDPSFFEGDNALIEARRIELQGELRDHGHPNLIEVLEAGHLEEDGTWFLLMEFCPWPSLEKQIASVPDDQVHSVIKQVVQAVKFLDEKGYVHRDIKPANIVVSADYKSVKLLDLGVLRKVSPDEGSGTDDRKFIATAQYSPPEFLSREELPGARGFQAINVYQVGAVLHDMIMKVPLFGEEAATRNKFILFKAVTEKTPRVVNSNVPVRLVTLCRAALQKDPEARVSSATLDDFLADADCADALRRRIRGGGQVNVVQAPSLVVYAPQVRSWVGAAARLERETLGAAIIRTVPSDRGARWSVKFANAGSTVLVDLRVGGGKLSIQVVSETDPPVASVVVEIGPDGPDLEPSDIPGAIAVQLLYALDLALAAQGAAGQSAEVVS